MSDAPDSTAYHGCPCIAYLPWWMAGVRYAQMAEDVPGWSHGGFVSLGAGDVGIVEASADAWSLYHFMLFWGFVDGRL